MRIRSTCWCLRGDIHVKHFEVHVFFFPNYFNTFLLLGRIFLKKHPEKRWRKLFKNPKNPGIQTIKQGCRFVPSTFSNRWYQAGSKDWLPGFGGLIQGQIYFWKTVEFKPWNNKKGDPATANCQRGHSGWVQICEPTRRWKNIILVVTGVPLRGPHLTCI